MARVSFVLDAGPQPVGQDSRGILHPSLLHQRAHLTRYPPTDALRGLIDRFWAVTWDLPAGTFHAQQLLTHPGCNLSVGHPDAPTPNDGPGPIEARCNGVSRNLTTRTLQGQGWAVAAMTTPGGLGAISTETVATYTDRIIPLGRALDLDDDALIEEIVAQPDEQARIKVLAAALEGIVGRADPRRVFQARQVAEAAHLMEQDRSIRRLAQLCEQVGIGPRRLQRLFLRHAGVPPLWVLRRYRLLDAAEAVQHGQSVSWATIAAELGYADQAHLSRDFQAAIGITPSVYAASQPQK